MSVKSVFLALHQRQKRQMSETLFRVCSIPVGSSSTDRWRFVHLSRSRCFKSAWNSQEVWLCCSINLNVTNGCIFNNIRISEWALTFAFVQVEPKLKKVFKHHLVVGCSVMLKNRPEPNWRKVQVSSLMKKREKWDDCRWTLLWLGWVHSTTCFCTCFGCSVAWVALSTSQISNVSGFSASNFPY